MGHNAGEAGVVPLRTRSFCSSLLLCVCREKHMAASHVEKSSRECHVRFTNALNNLKAMQEEVAAAAGAAAGAGAAAHNVAFGKYTRQIWEAMNRTNWNVKPIGPLGEHIAIQPEVRRGLKQAVRGRRLISLT